LGSSPRNISTAILALWYLALNAQFNGGSMESLTQMASKRVIYSEKFGTRNGNDQLSGKRNVFPDQINEISAAGDQFRLITFSGFAKRAVHITDSGVREVVHDYALALVAASPVQSP
jgi:hypothetical protein